MRKRKKKGNICVLVCAGEAARVETETEGKKREEETEKIKRDGRESERAAPIKDAVKQTGWHSQMIFCTYVYRNKMCHGHALHTCRMCLPFEFYELISQEKPAVGIE